MLSHIHHINVAVADLPKSVKYFTHLLQCEAIFESLPQRSVKTARFKIGESLLVLVQPTSDTGPVAEILANKGEGIFLLSFATESIDATLQELELNYAEKRHGLEGWSVCDISPMQQYGVILQLTESIENNYSK